MPNFLIALAILVGGIWFIRKAARTSTSAMPGFLQKLAGGAIVGFAGLLAMRGSVNAAIPLFVFGLGLLGKGAVFPQGFNWGKPKTPGQKSRVATSVLSMELDHDSGGMDGEILKGPSRGKYLSGLTDEELADLHRLCSTAGDQSQTLLEAWLDRAKPEWREQFGTGSRSGSAGAGGKMSVNDAYAALGLKPGATAQDVKAAHRRLMKQVHPDHGGSDFLAAKINEAKDTLLAAL